MKKGQKKIQIRTQNIHLDKFKASKSTESEAATEGVLKEKVLLEISQNSQENTCARVSNCF